MPVNGPSLSADCTSAVTGRGVPALAPRAEPRHDPVRVRVAATGAWSLTVFF